MNGLEGGRSANSSSSSGRVDSSPSLVMAREKEGEDMLGQGRVPRDVSHVPPIPAPLRNCAPPPHTLAPAASIAAVLCRALSRRTRPGGERSERTPPPVVGLPCTTRAARALPQPACSQVWGGERSERTQPRLLQGVCLWACLSPQASLGRFPGARLRSSGAPYFAVAAPNSLSFRLLPSRSLCSASLPSSPPSYLQHSHTRVCAPPLPSIPLTCSTAMLASAPWP